MANLVSIDGRIVAPEDAVVSIFDRGFLYGDSVYDVMRTYGGVPFEREAHLARLARSAERIGLDLPVDAARLVTWTGAALAAAGNTEAGVESYVRVIVTRGAGELGLDPALAVDPKTVIIVRALPQPPRALYETGVEVALVHVTRNARDAIDPAAKTGNYLNNLLALREARSRGAYEAVMHDAKGRLAEGSTTNLFLVRDGRLQTPALEVGILAGVTRGVVLEVARGIGVEVVEGDLTAADLTGADESFLTSTIREILPVTRVDGRPVGGGAPGPVTRRLQAAFRARTGPPLDEDRLAPG